MLWKSWSWNVALHTWCAVSFVASNNINSFNLLNAWVKVNKLETEVFFYTMNSVDNWICSKEIEARSVVEFLEGVGFLVQANKMKGES